MHGLVSISPTASLQLRRQASCRPLLRRRRPHLSSRLCQAQAATPHAVPVQTAARASIQTALLLLVPRRAQSETAPNSHCRSLHAQLTSLPASLQTQAVSAVPSLCPLRRPVLCRRSQLGFQLVQSRTASLFSGVSQLLPASTRPSLSCVLCVFR